jgi:hypothetical protein
LQLQSGLLVEIETFLQEHVGQHRITESSVMLGGSRNGLVKPPHVIGPSQPRIVSYQMLGGMLHYLWIKRAGNADIRKAE